MDASNESESDIQGVELIPDDASTNSSSVSIKQEKSDVDASSLFFNEIIKTEKALDSDNSNFSSCDNNNQKSSDNDIQNTLKNESSDSTPLTQESSDSDDKNLISKLNELQYVDLKSTDESPLANKDDEVPQRRRSSRIREKQDVKVEKPEVKKHSKTKKTSSVSKTKNEPSASSDSVSGESIESFDSNYSNSININSLENPIVLCTKLEAESYSLKEKTSKTKSKSPRERRSTASRNEKKESSKRSSRRKKSDQSKSVPDPDVCHPKQDEKESRFTSEIEKYESVQTISSPGKLSAACEKVLNPSENRELKIPQTLGDASKKSQDSMESTESSKDDRVVKPEKVKSRWWRCSELEGVLNSPSVTESVPTVTESGIQEMAENSTVPESNEMDITELTQDDSEDKLTSVIITNTNEEASNIIELSKPPEYENIEDNIYRFEKKKSKSKKEVRRMLCDCTLSEEEIEYNVLGCTEECLNRLLMIECGSRCPTGSACSNKKFKNKQYVRTETFKTLKKGWGLQALEDTSAGEFVMEFVGEVLRHKEYKQRVKQYAKEKIPHYYFMALKTDEIIDATKKGNTARFINHSCEPNCETQKWTVNGELRVGIFTKRCLQGGEELTLDYQFQRYGREAQKCYCEAESCTGFIGEAKQISLDSYGGSKSSSTKRKKGVDEKKKDWEDIILEEEIQKLNENKGLRNRDETLKLARLMVRADDSHTRHQLLDIILKTEEQACLRLFLNFHGLPLIWSWMTDVVDKTLKIKILKVLSLLPIQNKTILLNSKVLHMVEKWSKDSSQSIGSLSPSKKAKIEVEAAVSQGADADIALEPSIKKQKGNNSDSETDSLQNIDSNSSENETTVSSKLNSPSDDATLSEVVLKPLDDSISETLSECVDAAICKEIEGDPIPKEKSEIANLSGELLELWKDLKEEFRIPRLEQQRIIEDRRGLENALEKNSVLSPKISSCDQCIPVIISSHSGNSAYADHKEADYNTTEKTQSDDQQQKNATAVGPRLSKQTRRHLFAMKVQNLDKELALKKQKEDSSSESPSPISQSQGGRPALLSTPNYPGEPPKLNFSQSSVETASPLPALNFPPPQVIYQQPPQISFLGAPPPVLSQPPPNVAIPQKTSIANIPLPLASPFPQSTPLPQTISRPPTIPVPQNVPIHPNPSLPQSIPLHPNASLPSVPLQQGSSLPQNMPIHQSLSMPGAPGSSCQQMPANPGNFVIPANQSQTQVLPGTSQQPMYIPGQAPPMVKANYAHGQSSFVNQGQPLYYFQQTCSTSADGSQQTAVQVPATKEEISPSKITLPPNWRTATDSEGNIYYYHSITRQTQWDPPTADQVLEEDDSEESSEDSDTPTYDEPKHSHKRKTKKAAADTSVMFPLRPEIAKKIKELFRTKISTFVVHCLNSYRKSDCAVGRITSNEDFKYLARKLTHYAMTKELKQCKNVEELDCNDCVKRKTRDFIEKYMAKHGSHYTRKSKGSPQDD